MSTAFKRFVPLLNRILVKKIEPVQKSPGGIILQDNSDKGNIGEVVEVGPGIHDGKVSIAVVVKKGDTVLLPEYGGTEIKLREGAFYVFRDTDIVGVLHKD